MRVALFAEVMVGLACQAHTQASVQMNATGGGMDVLKTALHAGGNAQIAGTMIAIDGPVSTNGTRAEQHASFTA